MLLEWNDEAVRQHRYPVLHPLAVPHYDASTGSAQVCRWAKSTSFTRNRRHSMSLKPLPYSSLAINWCVPDRQPRTLRVSSLVRTVGNRFGRLARIASMGRSNSCLSTSRYRNRRALRASLRQAQCRGFALRRRHVDSPPDG